MPASCPPVPCEVQSWSSNSTPASVEPPKVLCLCLDLLCLQSAAWQVHPETPESPGVSRASRDSRASKASRASLLQADPAVKNLRIQVMPEFENLNQQTDAKLPTSRERRWPKRDAKIASSVRCSSKCRSPRTHHGGHSTTVVIPLRARWSFRAKCRARVGPR